MATKITNENRKRRIKEKVGFLTESIAVELRKDSDKGSTDPKKVDAFVKLLDRFNGNTPGSLPKSKTNTNDIIIQETAPNIPDLPEL